MLGIFQPHIVYLLCLATPVDIVLLGVSFLEPSDASESGFMLSLYLLVLQTVHLQQIRGFAIVSCMNLQLILHVGRDVLMDVVSNADYSL